MTHPTMPTEEVEQIVEDTEGPLIASTKVQGTPVFRPNGDKIGEVRHVMIDKRSGQTSFVVMNFGGFLGLGEEAYPLNWQDLSYNPELDGYEVRLTDEQLHAIKGGPVQDYEAVIAPFPPMARPIGQVA